MFGFFFLGLIVWAVEGTKIGCAEKVFTVIPRNVGWLGSKMAEPKLQNSK